MILDKLPLSLRKGPFGWVMDLLPESITGKLDPDSDAVLRLVKFASGKVNPGSRVLDAGAGNCPFEPFFRHTDYIPIDFCRAEKQREHGYGDMVAYSDLSNIPFRSGSFDMILCTQVLEHMPEPENTLREFYRLIKPGGDLFLTVPQSQWEHLQPYDYFRFTSFGMQYLFEKTGFETRFVEPKGGYFLDIGYRLSLMQWYLFPQTDNLLWRILRIPFKQLFQFIFVLFVPLVCHCLDSLDKEKRVTLGYLCWCRKPA